MTNKVFDQSQCKDGRRQSIVLGKIVVSVSVKDIFCKVKQWLFCYSMNFLY